MKKIPTLFKREYQNHKVVGIIPELSDPSLQWVLDGEGEATVKIDGACCAIIDGIFYRRFDAKKGRKIPKGAIPCCDPDPVTGHWPYWVLVEASKPDDKWFIEAYYNTFGTCNVFNASIRKNTTYEAVGLHFQGNPYGLKKDILVEHGRFIIKDLNLRKRDFETIREYLRTREIEGIVFWKDGEPKCKIKRSDFGFEWPVK